MEFFFFSPFPRKCSSDFKRRKGANFPFPTFPPFPTFSSSFPLSRSRHIFSLPRERKEFDIPSPSLGFHQPKSQKETFFVPEKGREGGEEDPSQLQSSRHFSGLKQKEDEEDCRHAAIIIRRGGRRKPSIFHYGLFLDLSRKYLIF